MCKQPKIHQFWLIFRRLHVFFSKMGQDIQKSWPEKFLMYVVSMQTKYQLDFLKNVEVSKNVIM